MTETGPWSQRLAIFLTSAVIILTELALMRELALRFWEHLAWLAISIGLLGFGISGTVLVLVHHFLRVRRQSLQCFSLMALGLSLPTCVWLADMIEVNLIQMVWQPSLLWGVGALEMVLGIPFLLGGMFLGLALEDKPENVGGHYAANFLGSGAGGIAALPLMFVIPPRLLILLGGCTIFFASLLLVRRAAQAVSWIMSLLILAVLLFLTPHSPRISDEKDIVQIRAMGDTRSLSRRYSPQGLIELVEAPAFHTAPGLALNYSHPVPPQTLIVLDGQVAGSLYMVSSVRDFVFMDHTTMALPYEMSSVDQVLIDHDPGVDQMVLALFHKVEKIKAVAGNSQLADLMNRQLDIPGIRTDDAGKVVLTTGTLREQLRRTEVQYPLIVLPTGGTDSAGLAATEPDSRTTIETMRLSFSHLGQNGLLSVSTAVHQPPRESLRLLNLLVEVLLETGREPAAHLAMIRNWSMVTIVAARSPLAPDQLKAVRAFCLNRGFDLVWLPGLKKDETNVFHLLETDDYYHGAKALVGAERNRFVSDYLYDLSVPDDNRPFFKHFSRWPRVDEKFRLLGRYGRTHIELGSILLAAALGQALLLALIFIVLPLVPVIGLPGGRAEQLSVLGFFSFLGFGFMLLEIGLLHRLTVYLAHPVWASATVISAFMLFGGVGSSVSTMVHKRLAEMHLWIIIMVIGVAIMLLLVIDTILGLTEGSGLAGRISVSYTVIAPLAMVMGMVFPIGLKRLGTSHSKLIPWAWSANGFTSVLATLLAQIIAMRWGFEMVVWSAIGCYGLAASCSLKLPEGPT